MSLSSKEVALFARLGANMLRAFTCQLDDDDSAIAVRLADLAESETRGAIAGYHNSAQVIATTMGISHGEVVGALGWDLDLTPFGACLKLHRYHTVASLEEICVREQRVLSRVRIDKFRERHGL